jgi:hypothetical protein
MKKLSMMLAAMALVAVGCDPYEDAPGGDPAIVTVTAAGRTAAGVNDAVTGTEAGGQWTVDGVPVGTGGNNVIVVTTNKLLDGSTIQSAPQDPADATSAGDCTPANSWLTITRNGAPEPLNYADPATPTDNWQWYTCYYPGAATTSYGASIQIFRAKVSQAPGFATGAAGPMRAARLEPDVTYVFTGNVSDESGSQLPINVTVSTVPVPAA